MKLFKYALVVGLLLLAATAYADVFQTYNLAWSGASFGNGATATGQITLDLTTLPNPGGPFYDMYNDITSLTLTVTGASVGNGTWTRADLCACSAFGTYTYWDTGGGALNLTQQLVGQPTLDGGPWGTPDGSSGDFNFFFTNGGPLGTNPFTMTTDGGNGDPMLLTSVAPVSGTTPEPGSLFLMGSGLVLLAGTIRRRFLL
jgi:hypothetical protein